MGLRLGYHPTPVPAETPPFTSLKVISKTTLQQSNQLTIIGITGTVSNNKVILDWQVGQNEKADRLLVEKSTNGIDFKVAALVFTSEKNDKESYQFYEKAGNGKWIYRVILIGKDKQTIYSPLVEINGKNH